MTYLPDIWTDKNGRFYVSGDCLRYNTRAAAEQRRAYIYGRTDDLGPDLYHNDY